MVQAICQLQRCAQSIARIAQAVDQAQCMQPLGGDLVATHQQLGGQRAWKGVCQAPTGASVGRQGHVAVGHQKYCIARRHHHVAGQCQRKACASRSAFHRRNDGLGVGADGLNPLVQAFNALGLHFGGLLAVGLQALQVATRAEHAARACDNHAAHIGAALGHVERFDARRAHGGLHRIAQTGVAQGQYQRLTFTGAQQLGGHGFSFLRRGSGSGRWRPAGAARGWGGNGCRRTRSAC